MFGSYGKGPGQFIYPVGICNDSAGNIYVSEYGENDRVQKFDSDGRWLQAWGDFGDAPGFFRRPSGMDCSDAPQIYVADAVNHRLQVFDTSGTLIRLIGGQGTEPGLFRQFSCSVTWPRRSVWNYSRCSA
jgi:DNA-binding beta-propeller fold protein YncE